MQHLGELLEILPDASAQFDQRRRVRGSENWTVTRISGRRSVGSRCSRSVHPIQRSAHSMNLQCQIRDYDRASGAPADRASTGCNRTACLRRYRLQGMIARTDDRSTTTMCRVALRAPFRRCLPLAANGSGGGPTAAKNLERTGIRILYPDCSRLWLSLCPTRGGLRRLTGQCVTFMSLHVMFPA